MYSALPHLNGNLLASVDVETTGRRAGWHEIVQIGIRPLNADIRPLEGVTPFYTTMVFRFSGEQLMLDSEHNVAFGPTTLPQLVGQAGQAE